MKKYLIGPFAAAIVSAGILPAQAAEVGVQWENPSEYRDMRATNGGQKRFEERVMKKLGERFAEQAGKYLPAGQQLNVNVTDVDLAGWIDFWHGPYNQEVRVIRDVDFPTLSFRYQLRDESGEVIGEGEEELKDLGFRFGVLDRTRTRFGDELFYEKRLIDEWFTTQFGDRQA